MRNERSRTDRGGRSFIEQARRAQIIEAAAATVAEVGYAKASLARIAQRGGISKGVLTYHFATKDEMLRLAATQFFDDAWAYMAPRITAADSADSKIPAWIRDEFESIVTHRTPSFD